MVMNNTFVPGLRGVVAAETRLSRVDGLAGELIIGGYPLLELAGNATFEQVVYLLWHDRLPDATELSTFTDQLAAGRSIPQIALEALHAAANKKLPVMDALGMAASTLSLELSDPRPEEAAIKAVSAFPTIVAAYWRYRQGEQPLSPRSDLGHAANYLYMLSGETPSPARTRALETYLNTIVDHGLNASTFTARVIISTGSDMIAAMVGAVGALKGPRHGGAPGPALDMVFEIGEADKAEAYLRAKLEAGERLMGFGHRVYKVRDPRADALGAAAEQFFATSEKRGVYHLAKHVEGEALRLLEEYKPGRNLQTNVEFYTALLLHSLDFPTELFTPTFALGRVAGWTAHAFEQQAEGSIIRPASAYVGATNRRWTTDLN